ncbi:sigma-E factor regulatory protein RseB domain-containing protein [Myceligenerans cantabricum]
MRRTTKALVAAGSGIAVGAAGLVLTTLPAGADDAPVLPEVDAEQLVTSALEAQPPAFAGVAEVDNQLGLPPVPGTEALDFESARVFHDGQESARIQVERAASELTFVKSTDEAWAYDSAEHTARHFTWDAADAAAAEERAEGELADPSQAAAEIIARLRPTSDIFVDGTARVADRAAYELVLTPKPSEKTLLREVTVAIDEETRVPLRFDVFANGTSDPVLSAGFTEFELGAQAADLFEFTPPEGAQVETTEADDVAHEKGEHGGKRAEDLQQGATTVGDGWDTVVIGEVPAGAGPGDAAPFGQELGDRRGGDDEDLSSMLGQIGAPVSGEFGTGLHVQIAVGGAVLTEDGRVAAGAVPQQVLVDALDRQ